MASEAAATREFFVVHHDIAAQFDGDQGDCLRLFTSRSDAEIAAERSANEAHRRYWWGYCHEDDGCEPCTNDTGEREFVAKAETHNSTFALRTIVAAVIGGDECEGEALQLHAFGIVANKLLGGDGAREFPSTADEGCVFVGAGRDAAKAAAVNRARAFARELTANDPSWFSHVAAVADDRDLLVVQEGEGGWRRGRPPQEGSDACLTLRIRTQPNPDYDYEADGLDGEFYPITCSTIKVVELPVGAPDEGEYESKAFFHEWTKFPRAATPEMERRLRERDERNRRALEEAIERSKKPREKPAWMVELDESVRQWRELNIGTEGRQRNGRIESNIQEGG